MVSAVIRRAACLAAPVSAALLAGAQAAAQEGVIVRATDATGLMEVLEAAQFEGLEYVPPRAGGGSAYITLTSNDLTSLIIFQDCDPAVPEFCDTLMLSTSWNRNLAISDAAIAKANSDLRYVSVWRDDEGDPYAQWAILTGNDGVAAPLFLDALTRYLDVVQDFWMVAFEGDDRKSSVSDAPVAMRSSAAGAGS